VCTYICAKINFEAESLDKKTCLEKMMMQIVEWIPRRVARWFILRPKIPIWACFGVP
jgi:hypothetical protein